MSGSTVFARAPACPRWPPGLFLETSPWLNLLLTPEIVRRERALPLDPKNSSIWKGASAAEGPFDLPDFPRGEGPAGLSRLRQPRRRRRRSHRAHDHGLRKIPARFIVNVGGFREAYRAVPDNVYLDAWFPQPSVVANCDLFIHHGGNNSFCEALYFGVPSLIMPYCWDGHDNAQRAVETGVGLRLDRASWKPDESRGQDGDIAGGQADKRPPRCKCYHDGRSARRFARCGRCAYPGNRISSK